MGEDRKKYEVEIGGETYVVDPEQEEDYTYKSTMDEDLGEVEGDPHPQDQDLMADPDAAAAMRPALSLPAYAGIRGPGVSRLCKNDRCTNLVTPSANPGVEKLFCERACGRNYHARMYDRRTKFKGEWLVERHKDSGEEIHFNRTKPNSLSMAERRYQSHIRAKGVCPNATQQSGGVCPSHALEDYYSKNKYCLIYATLVDDLYEHFAKKRGELYARRWTDEDGHWRLVSDLPHMEYTKDE